MGIRSWLQLWGRRLVDAPPTGSAEVRTRRENLRVRWWLHQQKLRPSAAICSSNISTQTGWWFGCHFLFSHILRMSSSQLTDHIFQKGWPWPTNPNTIPSEATKVCGHTVFFREYFSGFMPVKQPIQPDSGVNWSLFSLIPTSPQRLEPPGARWNSQDSTTHLVTTLSGGGSLPRWVMPHGTDARNDTSMAKESQGWLNEQPNVTTPNPRRYSCC